MVAALNTSPDLQRTFAPVRLPLIPRENKFYDLFVEDAANMVAAARVLEQLMANYEDRERLASQLRDLEHAGDVLTHDIGRALEATFVTPFDREDILAFINRLDDVVDLIEEVADTFLLYGIEEPTEVAIQQVEIIVRQCEQIAQALGILRSFKGLDAFWIEIHRLENEGDRIVRRGIAELFKNGSDAVEVIKWKDLYSLLEEAIDACEDVANVIERIVVKHA
jgi:predicted phosphate transport protein (TIGR00153 family)